VRPVDVGIPEPRAAVRVVGRSEAGRPVRIALVGHLRASASYPLIESWLRRRWQVAFVHVDAQRPAMFLGHALDALLHVTPSDVETAAGARRVGRFLADYQPTGVTAATYRDAWRLHRWRPWLPAGMPLWIADPSVLSFLECKTAQLDLARR